MPQLETRMSHLVRWNAKKGEAYVHVFAFSVPRDAQSRMGRVYGLLSADAKSRKGEALAAHVEDVFDRAVEEALRKLPADAPQDQLFEGAIARVNQALGRLFGEYGLDVEPERIHAAIVAIKDRDVVAAVWGKPVVLLFHPLPNAATKVLDLVDDSKADKNQSAKAPGQRRCFGSIIAGRMGARDRIVVSTHDLRPFIGEDRLEAMIVPNDPDGATELIRDRLSPIEESVSIAVLILDVAEIRYVEQMRPAAARPEDAVQPRPTASLGKLIKTETDTGETMQPSLAGSIKKKVGGPLLSALTLVRKHEKAAGEQSPSEERPSPANRLPPADGPKGPGKAARAAKAAFAGGTVALKAAFGALWSLTKGLGRLLLALGSAERRRRFSADLRGGMERSADKLVERFNALSGRSRALLFSALTLVLAAEISVAVGSVARYREDRIAEYERAVTAVEQTIDSAEASMIYRDEARARQLLDEAAIAASALPEKKPEQKEAKEGLERRIAGARDALRHVVPLGEPQVVANIVAGEGAAADLARLAIAADGIVWGATAKGDLFKVTLENGAAERIGDAPGAAAPTVFLAMGRELLAASREGAAATYTLAGKRNDRSIEAGDPPAEVADADLYNARLYILDAAHNRILRHPVGAGGFGKAQHYLQDGTDVSQAVSMTIDGAVYVLRRDGSILRIAKGLREEFGVSPVDPPVTAPLRLRTTAASEFLYVLDSSPARILKYSKKSGALMAQYTSDALAGASDMLIDEKGGSALVAAGNRLLRFSLPE